MKRQKQIIVLPVIEAMMSGVFMVERYEDLTVLVYTDNTREAATIPAARWNEIMNNSFAIVSTVQATARSAKRQTE